MSEFERQKKVINMMITAHSVLRDRYVCLSQLFENTLLIASVVLNALVFIDSAFILKITKINEDNQKLIIGLSSIIVFAITIVLLQVKWKEKAENHSKAADQLFSLLQECRKIIELTDEGSKASAISEFEIKYTLITGTLIKIPDSKFNSLKLIHYRKIELSKLIDKNPSSILLILKLKMFLSSFKKKT